MKVDGDGFVLASGRRFYANERVLGLNEDDLRVTEGYDGTVESSYEGFTFTPAERAEVADYMIALWQRWKTQSKPEGTDS